MRFSIRLLCAGMLALFLFPLLACAQEDAENEERAGDAPDSLGAWDYTLSSKLSGSQAAYSNWRGGGVNTIALTGGVSGKATRRTRRLEQTYDLRLALGFIRQDSLLKADDLIRLGGALQYRGNGFFRRFNPTIAADARTQFAAGFNYDEVPRELVPDGAAAPRLPVKISSFMSPGLFTQTLGLTYDPRPWFTQRLGIASKQTVVTIDRLRPLYNLELDDPVRIEGGLSSTTEVDREIFENVRLQSILGFFYGLNATGNLPDATFENVITMQVNKWLGVDFEFSALYDRDISDEMQLKEVLSVGVTYVFI